MSKRKSNLFIMPLIIVLLLAVTSLAFASNTSFKDIDGSYAKDEILVLHEEGILSGKGEGIFSPKDNMTRAELAKVLSLSLELGEDVSFAKRFTDVPQTSWYAGYVGALAKSGITTGTSTTNFSPNANVTREELAVFFIRALGLEEEAKEFKIEPDFTDKTSISSWAREEIGLATDIGFITGIANNDGSYRYEPKSSAQRQALALLAYKLNYNKSVYIAKIKDKIEDLDEKTPPEDEGTEPGIKDPVDPIEPIEPEQPIEPTDPTEPTDPIDPIDPPEEVDEDEVMVANVIGKQRAFLNSYLMSVEFDIEGTISVGEVIVLVNEDTDREIKLKMGEPELRIYYFDGMAKSIDTLTVYVDGKRFDITNKIVWR